MAVAINRENFLLHKIHSLTGVIPIGFYMIQHISLNSFSLAGAEYFNRVIGFFESWPKHVLLAFEVMGIWIPILFHAIYGVFIVARAQPNLHNSNYRFRENRYYTWQRWSGIFVFLFLIYHVLTTTVAKMVTNDVRVIEFNALQERFVSNGYAFFILYLLGVLAACYHLSYGLWGFMIRWGFCISDAAQKRMWRFSQVMFVVTVLIGWGALLGFIINKPTAEHAVVIHQPMNQTAS